MSAQCTQEKKKEEEEKGKKKKTFWCHSIDKLPLLQINILSEWLTICQVLVTFIIKYQSSECFAILQRTWTWPLIQDMAQGNYVSMENNSSSQVSGILVLWICKIFEIEGILRAITCVL